MRKPFFLLVPAIILLGLVLIGLSVTAASKLKGEVTDEAFADLQLSKAGLLNRYSLVANV